MQKTKQAQKIDKSSAKKSRRKRKPGIKEISIMATFQALQLLSSKLASWFAFQLWFHPGRKSVSLIPAFKPEGMSAKKVKLGKKTICYWTAGEGPCVFLMHGWASCGDQMGLIGQALLDKGYKIIWMDAPAHGESSGWQTNLFEISEAILAVQNCEGDFDTILAHSFGVPSSLYALKKGLVADKLVAISTPASFASLVVYFCKLLKANQNTQKYLTLHVNRFLGELTMNDISAEHLAKSLHQKALVVHDKHDRLVRSKEGKAVQKNLINSRFILTEKLGHNKVLSDPQTIEHYVEFIAAEDAVDTLMSA